MNGKKSAIFLLLFLQTVLANISLNDHVVKMEQVILSVEYNQRHLNVWKESSHGYDRFYVTPLCTLDTTSINCSRDEYSNEHRHALAFHVKIWDAQAAETVKLALAQKNIVAKVSDILPLPMLMIRLGVNEGVTQKVHADKQWRSNQDQPNIISFELYTRHEHFCDKMTKDAKSDPEKFLTRTKLFLEFTMVVGQQASRNLKITGDTLVKSNFFSNLANKHSDKNGIILLASSDLNKLSQDIYRVASAEDNVTSTYVPSEQESQIISELLDVIKGQTIHSNDLTNEQWKSVFWNDIFSRPDVQTEYFNEVLKYDEGEKHFKYNTTSDKLFREKIYSKHHQESESSDSFGFGFSYAGFGFDADEEETEKTKSTDEEEKKVKKDSKNTLSFGVTSTYEESEDDENKYDKKMVDKNTLSFDDLQKHLKKDNINVKWSGTKFTPKDLLLYRVNTKSLKATGNVYYKRIVTTNFHSAQRIEIRPGSKRQIDSANLVSPVFYEDLKKQIISLKHDLDNTTSKFQHLHDITTELKNTDADLRNQLKTSENNVANQIAAVNQQITNTANQITADLNTRFEKTKQQTAELQARLESILPRLPPCPSTWSHFETTGFCYKVFRNADWQSAENACQQNGAHLASIHSLEEANFVGKLAYIPGAEQCDGAKQALIGLSSDDNHASWKWTDGTPVDYIKWGPNQPDNPGLQNCAKIFTASNTCTWNLGDFDNMECSSQLSSYVCKKASG